MSYHVWLVNKHDRAVTDTLDCTSNVSEIWELALGFPFKECDRQKASLAEPALRRAIKRLRDERFRSAFTALEPGNGWGSVDGATQFLEDLANLCHEYPDNTIKMWR